MTTKRNRWMGGALALVGATLSFTPPPTAAQQRLLIPDGTVLTVRTEDQISSTSAQVGQTFRTTLIEPLRMQGYTVLPQGSFVQGQITTVRPATRNNSGIVGVEFNQLTLPSGRSIPINGKLTSTDPNERRQIDAQGGANVVLVGGRSGVGAGIAGIGTNDSADPLSGVLGALGSLFSNGTEVNLPRGTTLAVQLMRGLNVSVSGSPTGYGSTSTYDPYSLYTTTELIRSAQQALRQRDYYRGVIDGQLNDETQRALFEFQTDNRIAATGNLDGRTAQALGLALGSIGTGTGGSLGTGVALTADQAGQMRRGAQTLVGQWRASIGVQANGRLDARRDYRSTDLEAYFALSGFADNASLYEQMVRANNNPNGVAAASAALAASARRVDEALRNASAPSRITTSWSQLRGDLNGFDSGYTGGYR